MNKPLLVFLLLIPLFVLGQSNTFIKTYNKANRNTSLESLQAYDLVNSYNNGYLVVGKEEDNNKLLIIETDSAGDIIWSRRYSIGAISGNEYFKVINTSDSCYLVSGGLYDGIFCLKISRTGQIIWIKMFPLKYEYGQGYVKSLFEVNQLDYIFLVEDQNSTNNFCFKLDKSGNLLWSKNFYNSASSLIRISIEKLSEDKLVLSGVTASGENCFISILDSALNYLKGFKYGNAKYVSLSVNNNSIVLLLIQEDNSYLMNIDTSGIMRFRRKVNWIKSINDRYRPNTFMVHYNKDSTYLCINNTSQNSGSVLKVDNTGKLIYALSPLFNNIGSFIHHDKDSSLTILGNGALQAAKTESYSRHIGLIKVDSNGNSKGCVYNSNSFVTVDSIFNGTNYTINMRDTGQIMDISASSDSVKITVDSGCLGYVGGIYETGEKYFVKLSPTTLINVFSVETDKPDFEVWVTNFIGQTVYRRMCKNENKVQIDLSNKDKGVYLVRLNFGDGIFTSKILID